MSNHSVIEHRANYFFLKLEEDYIAICQGKHEHCKAAILSILEHWMNSKRAEDCTLDDLYVYLSYPQFVKQMFGLFSRSTVIKSLQDLIIEGLVRSRPYVDASNQKTFVYRLDIQAVNEKLRTLPEKPVGSVNLNGGSVNLDDPPSKNTLGGSVKVNDGSVKVNGIIDYIDTNIDSSQITESTLGANAPARAHLKADLEEAVEEKITDLARWKEESDKHKAIKPPLEEEKHDYTYAKLQVRNLQIEKEIAEMEREEAERNIVDSTIEEIQQTPSSRVPGGRGDAALVGSPAGNDHASSGGPRASDASTIPKRSRGKKPVTLPEPTPKFNPTEQQQHFWSLWCGVWFNQDIPPEMTETAYKHVVKLAPHITDEKNMNSLIDYTRKELQETQGIRRKAVQLGNCVNSYRGWKQLQREESPPSPEQEQDEDYSDFDRYVGNGKEERAQLLREYEERLANGTLI